jgi:hypothetical protein
LAPDSVNEIFEALELIEYAVGKAYLLKENKLGSATHARIIKTGKQLLIENNPIVDQLEVLMENIENSGRKVKLIKARSGYLTFREMVQVYCAEEILNAIEIANPKNITKWLKENIHTGKRKSWVNAGGQLIEEASLNKLISNICSNKVKSWEDIHIFFGTEMQRYQVAKLAHALSSYYELFKSDLKQYGNLTELLDQAFSTKSKMLKNMISSREKDYTSPFRTMAYINRIEMDAVTGKLEENSFIVEQTAALKKMKVQINKIKRK